MLAGPWANLLKADTTTPSTKKVVAKTAPKEGDATPNPATGKGKEVAKKEKKWEPPKSAAQKMAEKEAKAKEDAAKKKEKEAAKAAKEAEKERKAALPKKPQSGYFMFSNEKREEFKAANPDAKVTDMAKLLGEAWGKLSDEEKAPYEAKAKEDKERYERECEEAGIVKEPSAGEKRKAEKAEERDAAKAEKAAAKAEKDAQPKKPLGPYFIYMAEKREEFKAANPDAKNADLGKLMGAAWKELSDEDKAPYCAKAKDDKARYERECEEAGIELKKPKEPKAKKPKAEKPKKEAGEKRKASDDGEGEGAADDAAAADGEADAAAEKPAAEKKPKKAKKEKVQHGPTDDELATRQTEAAEAIGKPNGAFRFYKKVHLGRVAEELPDADSKDVLKELKRQYAELDDGSKAEYLEKEAAETARYEAEVAAAKAAVAAEVDAERAKAKEEYEATAAAEKAAAEAEKKAAKEAEKEAKKEAAAAKKAEAAAAKAKQPKWKKGLGAKAKKPHKPKERAPTTEEKAVLDAFERLKKGGVDAEEEVEGWKIKATIRKEGEKAAAAEKPAEEGAAKEEGEGEGEAKASPAKAAAAKAPAAAKGKGKGKAAAPQVDMCATPPEGLAEGKKQPKQRSLVAVKRLMGIIPTEEKAAEAPKEAEAEAAADGEADDAEMAEADGEAEAEAEEGEAAADDDEAEEEAEADDDDEAAEEAEEEEEEEEEEEASAAEDDSDYEGGSQAMAEDDE